MEQAASLKVAGALLETNVVAHYQNSISGTFLSIQYSIEKEQNVTFMYLKEQLNLIKEAREFITCMEANLYAAANSQRPTLKVWTSMTDSRESPSSPSVNRRDIFPFMSYFRRFD